MPEYLAPGVYVEEVPSAVKPIAGVSPSTAGFIAVVPDSVQLPGPIKGSGSPPKFASVAVTPAAANEVKLVTSWSDFVKYFGDVIGGEQPATATAVDTVTIDDGYRRLAQAGYGLFNKGGPPCFLVGLPPPGDPGKGPQGPPPLVQSAGLAV